MYSFGHFLLGKPINNLILGNGLTAVRYIQSVFNILCTIFLVVRRHFYAMAVGAHKSAYVDVQDCDG